MMWNWDTRHQALMTFVSVSQFHIYSLWVNASLLGTFNKEKALVLAYSVIVKLQSSRRSVSALIATHIWKLQRKRSGTDLFVARKVNDILNRCILFICSSTVKMLILFPLWKANIAKTTSISTSTPPNEMLFGFIEFFVSLRISQQFYHFIDEPIKDKRAN